MSDQHVKIERDETVATVTIDREEKRNALADQTVVELTEAFEELGQDEQLRAMVVTGAGDKAFCAGGDVGDQQSAGGPLGMHKSRGGFADMLIAMNRSETPIIARVNGKALGGGFGLLLNCDMAVAAHDATFGTPEIKLGLFPMMIMAVIQRNLHRKHAMEMMFTGKELGGERALEFGIVNRVADEGELDEELGELVDRVASFSPAILGLGRQAFYDTQDMSFEEALRKLHSELTINTLAEDAAEGIMAFMAKRDPEWKGK